MGEALNKHIQRRFAEALWRERERSLGLFEILDESGPAPDAETLKRVIDENREAFDKLVPFDGPVEDV